LQDSCLQTLEVHEWRRAGTVHAGSRIRHTAPASCTSWPTTQIQHATWVLTGDVRQYVQRGCSKVGERITGWGCQAGEHVLVVAVWWGGNWLLHATHKMVQCVGCCSGWQHCVLTPMLQHAWPWACADCMQVERRSSLWLSAAAQYNNGTCLLAMRCFAQHIPSAALMLHATQPSKHAVLGCC
jgi:hypothetical protein